MTVWLRLLALVPLVSVVLYAGFLLVKEAARGSLGAEITERLADEHAIADDITEGRS